ncbi:MAG: hypothetical protein Tsb0017_01350 [Geothermobacteraceae bacterium]
MRILLVTLHSRYVHASLALPYLAAVCHDLPVEVARLEFTLQEPKESLLAQILEHKPDLVAFSTYQWNRHATLELVDALHAARPEVRLVLGGPEVSFDGPELFRRHPGLYALVRGEGEGPFRALVEALLSAREPVDIPRLCVRSKDGIPQEGPEGLPLDDLDAIPSPFALGLVDTARGQIYLETSRGCPYDCAFCMSALDSRVRSFSMARIERDLAWLMEGEVPLVKLVDRTFNYDAARARHIWQFILEHNRASRFHFEIGAHLLTDACLELLARVPEGMFQFEIGVQSTLPATLSAVGRRASLDKLEQNVRALVRAGNIHLHLDLIFGLPGEDYHHFLASIDRVLALNPDHLQVEPVKLLPGAPLRRQAGQLGIRFDPNPPYTVLATPDLDFDRLEQLRAVSRLLDLTWNSRRFVHLYRQLAALGHAVSSILDSLASWCRARGALRHPLGLTALYALVDSWILETCPQEEQSALRQALLRDHARNERVQPAAPPPYAGAPLNAAETALVHKVLERMRAEKAQSGRLHWYACALDRLPGRKGLRTPALFTYRHSSGRRLQVEEFWLTEDGIVAVDE